MLWFCKSILHFPARCVRPGCAVELVRTWDNISMFVKKIIVNGVERSRGIRKLCLRTTCEVLGSTDDVAGSLRETLRCRLITEVQVSRSLGNRAETSGFDSADFLSGSETSTESVVFSRVRH